MYILLKFKFNVNKFLITRIYPVRKRTAFLFLLNVHYFNGVQLTPTNLFLFIQRKRISDLYDAHILQIKTLSFFSREIADTRFRLTFYSFVIYHQSVVI